METCIKTQVLCHLHVQKKNVLEGSDNMALKYTCKIALMQKLGHVITSMY